MFCLFIILKSLIIIVQLLLFVDIFVENSHKDSDIPLRRSPQLGNPSPPPVCRVKSVNESSQLSEILWIHFSAWLVSSSCLWTQKWSLMNPKSRPWIINCKDTNEGDWNTIWYFHHPADVIKRSIIFIFLHQTYVLFTDAD